MTRLQHLRNESQGHTTNRSHVMARRRMPLRAGLACLVAAIGAPTVPAGAGAATELTAIRVRIGVHAAFVRVVVDFTGAALNGNRVEAIDPQPFDGSASLRVTHPMVRTRAAARGAAGIRVRVIPGVGRLRIEIHAVRGRFKYLSYAVVTSNRLAIDLWKSAPPPKAAEVRRGTGGCLTLESVHVRAGVISATGHKRRVFENRFLVAVRGSSGRILTRRAIVAAAERWSVSVPLSRNAPQLGTLEAVVFSAKDGALSCLVQVRVTLPAAP